MVADAVVVVRTAIVVVATGRDVVIGATDVVADGATVDEACSAVPPQAETITTITPIKTGRCFVTSSPLPGPAGFSATCPRCL
jgi:hypothetical protein